MNSSAPSFQVIIIEVNAQWIDSSDILSNELSFEDVTVLLAMFGASHLMMNRENTLCIIASYPTMSKIIYPSSFFNSNITQPIVDHKRILADMISGITENEATTGSSLTQALSIAMCGRWRMNTT
jgi:hypothetical protein